VTHRWAWSIGTIALLACGEVAGRAGLPPAGAGPAATGTPIIDPGPAPATATPAAPEPVGQRLVLPALSKRHDPRLPPPLTGTARGYVATLNAAGRAACAPATHVLLSGPEGASGTDPIAVMHPESTDPGLELDLHVGEPVEVAGLVSLAPPGCRAVTWQLLTVTRVRRLELPPGEPP
jgi:hypothetical protein